MPDITSLHSCVETIVAVAVPIKGLCTLVSSGGISTAIHGGPSPQQGLCNLHEPWGRHLPFAGWGQGCTSHSGGGYGLWPSYIAGWCERTLGVGTPVLAVALLLGCGGFCGLRCPGRCYLYPVWRCLITKNFGIHEHHQRLHGFPQFPHTLGQLVWLAWHWCLGLLSPML